MTQNNWLVWIGKLILLSLPLSCSDSGSIIPDNPSYNLDLTECSTLTQNEYIHTALKDRYYWYQEIPETLDYADFNSPDETLDFLRKTPEDRFSYISDASEFDSFYEEGKYIGFGFAYITDSNGNVWIRYTYKDSPADNGGFERGDKIISIDGVSTLALINSFSLGDALGENDIGINKTFIIKKPNGQHQTINLTKSEVTINAVMDSHIINANNKTYAYLAFKTFITPAFAELENAFAGFAQTTVDKLILDLRYNGGGSINVAAYLGSYIHRPDSVNETFTELRFNDKYQSENYRYRFIDLVHSLNLDEVIILTSAGTCSASEMVINGLKPFIKVTTIGSTTCGKPIGMRPQSFCNKKLVAINFSGFNADNEGEYFDGIAVDCVASDDLSYPLGDPNENILKTALEYDRALQCPVQANRSIHYNKAPWYHGLKREIDAE